MDFIGREMHSCRVTVYANCQRCSKMSLEKELQDVIYRRHAFCEALPWRHQSSGSNSRTSKCWPGQVYLWHWVHWQHWHERFLGNCVPAAWRKGHSCAASRAGWNRPPQACQPDWFHRPVALQYTHHPIEALKERESIAAVTRTQRRTSRALRVWL